jgi:hypothetical protein
MKTLFSRCARMLRQWRLLHKEEDVMKIEECALELELRGTRPPRIEWMQEQPQLLSVSGSLARDDQVFRSSECGSDVLVTCNAPVAESVCGVCMWPMSTMK